MPRTGLFADSNVLNHDPGFGHPEQPARYTAVLDALDKAELLDRLYRLPQRTATDQDLTLVHSTRYLDLVGRETKAGQHQLSTGDTNINRESDSAARSAAGGALSAVEAVCDGTVVNAFCVVRPPGHHASSASGMGFCLYNNVAIAARYAQRLLGLERIAIVDWDVHHGNGTQDIFYNDGSVLFFSTHEWPLYPGTGAAEESGYGPGSGLTINCPFPAGSGRDEIFGAFRTRLLPALESFQPDLIIVSAGFDSREGDPLGHFRLTDRDFEDLTYVLQRAADQYCQGRLVSVLEGGYSVAGLGLAAAAHVGALVQIHR